MRATRASPALGVSLEVTEGIGGQRRPRELFVSDRFVARFPRVPRPADCGQP